MNQYTQYLGSQVLALYVLADKEIFERLEQAGNVITEQENPAVYLPRPPEGKNSHHEYALDAFEKFDQPTQKEFMKAFNTIVSISNKVADDNNPSCSDELNMELITIRLKVINATQLLLSEAEKSMIERGVLEKYSTAHSASLILYTPELVEEFSEKYSAQLKALYKPPPNNALLV